MKYVMLQLKLCDMMKKIPVLFPDMINHDTMAETACKALEREVKGCSVKVVSAGFVSSVDMDVTTYGDSVTLGIGAAPGDAEVIRMYDYLHGM